MRTRTLGVLAVLAAVALAGVPANAQQPAQEGQQDQRPQQQGQNEKQKAKEREKQNKDQEKQRRAQQRVQQQQTQQRAQEQQAQQRSHEQRFAAYSGQERQQQALASRQQQALQQQRRTAQSRVQQQYVERLHQDQLRLRDARPFNYSAYTYRYYRGGRYYQANQNGADMLQHAVNLGYEEGVRAGQSDREDRWRFDYHNAYAYQDATYGYSGYHVDLNEYRYYFREGCRRGYEDGYYSRTRYGTYSNGVFNLVSGVLQTILNLQRY